jgi:hypothetical protein
MTDRVDFINHIHLKFYNEDINEQLLANDPILFAKHIEGKQLSDSMEELLDITKCVVPKKYMGDIEYSDLLNLVEIKKHYEHGVIVCLAYNKLYDSLVEKKVTPSEKIKLYRIEGDSGKGIYMDLIGKDKPISSEFDFTNKTPAPMEDGALKSIFGSREYNSEEYQKEWNFAFKSKQDITKWFDSDKGLLDYIIKHGSAKVCEYEVNQNEVITTNHQAVFRIGKSKKISESILVNENKIKLKEDVKKYAKTQKVKTSQLGFDF